MGWIRPLFTLFPHMLLHEDEGKVTGLCVVHPVEDDLRGSVPAGHNVAGHLRVRLPRQAKIQDLEEPKAKRVQCVATLDTP